MKHLLSTVLLCALFCFSIKAQSIYVVDYEGFKTRIEQNSDTTYVVNFWATWCKPCIEEMHVFEELIKKTNVQPIKILMVSLDFERDITKVKTFLQNRQINADFFLLNATDPNTWISKIDASWSGGIPATLILNNRKNKRKFIEKGVSLNELEEAIRGL